MITTFRNLEISNHLLELDIPDNILEQIKQEYKKHKNLKIDRYRNLEYCVLKPTYKLSVLLSSPGFSHGAERVVTLTQRNGKDTDDQTWYQVSNIKFNFVPTAKEVDFIHYTDTKFNTLSNKRNTIFDNIDQYKKDLITNSRAISAQGRTHNYLKLESHINDDSAQVVVLLETMNWLYNANFDKTGVTLAQLEAISSKNRKFEWGVGFYYKVVDIDNNRRLALVGTTDRHSSYNYRWRNYSATTWNIIDVPHDNPAYNYIDAGTYATKFTEEIPGVIQFDATAKALPKSI